MTTNRLLQVTGGLNFRELGGYPTIDGHTVKWHKLVRSAGLANLTAADQDFLGDYGIVADVDFRSEVERDQAPDRLPTGAAYHFLPVFPDGDQTDASASRADLERRFSQDPQAGYQHMLDVYRNMVTLKSSQAAYRQFFQVLLTATEDHQAVLFHCTAGKDRTGIGAFLALSALGVDPQVIRKDYLATNTYIQPKTDEMVQRAQDDHQSDAFVANIRALGTVNPDYFDTATGIINTQYGGVQDYLRDVLGLTVKQLDQLKKTYLN